MTKPIIGFAGMTHLGLVSGVAASQKGFETICFDIDESKINEILSGKLPISEPKLEELILANADHILFTADINNLRKCDVIYVAPDVSTDDHGKSDLSVLNDLLGRVLNASNLETTIVVLSQVPPGFTRGKWSGKRSLYYQVETLIFGKAIERALYPERYIVGCANPAEQLPVALKEFLEAHNCPILPMRYESAELAKISINMFLVASVTTTNTLAELCEKIGADWSEISPALRLDRRIGPYAYLTPGLGVSGGNLERDMATIKLLSDENNTEASILQAWSNNSRSRKIWPALVAKNKLKNQEGAKIAIWGLAYKENTNSVKNSPSLIAISELQNFAIQVYDPIVKIEKYNHSHITIFDCPIQSLNGADALLIMTPWEEFKNISIDEIERGLNLKAFIVDPYGIIKTNSQKLEVIKLGVAN